MKDRFDHQTTQAALRRRSLLQGALALTLPGIAGAATTSWPTKPLRLIVGFPAGTSPDFLARVFADPLSRELGQPVIVENKAGAGGAIGVDAVAKATDGYTLGLTGNGPLTSAKTLNPKLPFDVARDLRPISLLAVSPFVLTGSMTLAGNDLPSIIANARTQGDKLNYGSIGQGSGSHLAMELLKSLTGIKPVHVPFQGFPQVATAMVGGQVDLGFMVPSIAVPLAQSGRLRILGVSTASRSPVLADVPPIAQALSLPTFDVAGWNAIFAPIGMPEAQASKVADALGRIARAPETRQKLFDQGWQSLGTAPEGLARKIKDDTALWGGIIRSAGIRSE